jgi:hypothetical protein
MTKFSEQIDRLTKPPVDSGSGSDDTETNASDSLIERTTQMREHLEHFWDCLRHLQELGVDVIEPEGFSWDIDDDVVDLGFEIAGIDAEASRLPLALIALGFYYGRLAEAYDDSPNWVSRGMANRAAGSGGGEGQAAKAEERRDEILAEYAKWAADPSNSRLPRTAFAERFSAAKKKKKSESSRGFGESTVNNVTAAFENQVFRVWQRLKLTGTGASASDVDRVVNEMAGQPGVNRETVRRALES